MKPLGNKHVVAICVVILVCFSASVNLLSTESLAHQGSYTDSIEEKENDHPDIQHGEERERTTDLQSNEGVDPSDWCEVEGGDTSHGEYITNVQFNGIDRDSGDDNGYADHTENISNLLERGETYEISVTMNTGGGFDTSYVTVVIDWSLDYDLTNEEVIEIGVSSNSPATVSTDITVPEDAAGGQTLMRVMQEYNSYHTDPCENQDYGETEDYTVMIGDPPSIELTRPTGGEDWETGHEEEILWNATEGEGNITGIDLEYSSDSDDGDNWTYIEEGLNDTGEYTWTVPDDSTAEARIRATVHADDNMSASNVTDTFKIMGDPPEPPEDLEVTRSGLVGEAVENKYFIGGHDPWELSMHGDGDSAWDGEEYYEEGGSIYSIASQEGDGESTQEAQWEQDIIPIGNEVVVNGAFYTREDLEHEECEILESTVEISLHDTEAGWQTIYSEDEIVNDWTEFGTEGNYTPSGLVDRVRASMRGTAEGHTEEGIILPTHYTATVELWMDKISVESVEEGTEHNKIAWDASPDDPEKVDRYIVFRSMDENDNFEEIASVEADGSDQYEYFDEMKGTEDEIWWYYKVYAESELDQRSQGTDVVREPGDPYTPSDPQPGDGETGVSRDLELSVYVEHEVGDPMDVSFYDSSDDSLIGTEDDIDSGDRSEVTWEDLEYGTTYEWYAVADDGVSTNESEIWSFTTERGKPTFPTDPAEPEDGATGVTTSPELGLLVEHEAEEPMDVFFHDASDDSVIGSDEDVASGDVATTTWRGLELDSTYEWYAVADDGEDSVTSPIWSFTTEGYTLTIEIEGEGNTDPPEGSHIFEPGTDVPISASAEEGRYLDEWTGDYEGDEEEITITMDEDKTVTAHFSIQEFELIIEIEGEGSTDPEEGSHIYEYGEEIFLEATPAEGWNFVGWFGDYEGMGQEIRINMDEDKNIEAHFEPQEFDLTIGIEGEGSTIPEEGTHTYTYGEEVTIEAEPYDGWYFNEWVGDYESEEKELTIEIDRHMEITAHFEIRTYELIINIEGDGSTIPEEGTHTYEHGEQVVVEAMPLSEEWSFVEWTGDISRTDEEITITMHEDMEINANFEELEPSNFEVEIIDYPEETKEGEEVSVKYRVRNTGELEDTQDIVLRIGGEEITRESGLTLGPSEEFEGEFNLDAENVGRHELEISSNDDTISRVTTIEEESFVSRYGLLIVGLLVIGIVIGIVIWIFRKKREEGEEEGKTIHKKETLRTPPTKKEAESLWKGDESEEKRVKKKKSPKKTPKKVPKKSPKMKKVKKKKKKKKRTEEKEEKVSDEEIEGLLDEEEKVDTDKKQMEEEKQEEDLDEDMETDTDEKEIEEEKQDEEVDEDTETDTDEKETEKDAEGTKNCPLCGNEVSPDAEKCFACGKDLKEEES